MNKLKSLVNLQFLKNPLNDRDIATTITQLFFAKIETLDSFNRYVVEKLETNEKFGAEIDYLKRFFKDYLKAHKSEKSSESDKLNFNREHPRYLDIIESNPVFN